MLTAASQGATSITGTLGSAFKDNAGANIATGSLIMLVVDNGSNGFLNLGSNGAVTSSLNGESVKNTITAAQAGIVAGGTFGGDTIVSTAVSGASGSIASLLSAVNVASYVNMNFAVVWFTATPAALATSVSNAYFGMIRLADWTLPASDSGAVFTLSSTDAAGATSYYSTSASATAAQVGTGFFTGTGTAANTGSTAVRSATFQVVPEPSAALLGALGALGLLRRRRI